MFFFFSFNNKDKSHEKEWDKEPTGSVLYVWRHDDYKPGDEYWEEEWTYHQLVAISQAKALPQPKHQPTDDDDDGDDQEGYDPYYSSYHQDYQATAGQVWHNLPWASIFDSFIRRGCSSQVRVPFACAMVLWCCGS